MWIIDQKLPTGRAKCGAIPLSTEFRRVRRCLPACDDKFHEATSEPDFVKFLATVRRKLGNVQESNLRNTGVAWHSGQGTTVTLVYDTKFSEGNASETFLWHIQDNNVALYGYNINSNELVTK